MSEACARLDCTPRQLRYRIKKGELKARKVDGRWHIDEGDLPRSPRADRHELERAGELREALEEGLAARRGRRRYTVEDLQVFTAVIALSRELRTRTDTHPASDRLVEAGAAIARGVHTYGGRQKSEAFGAARAAVAEAVALLHLVPVDEPWAVDIARALEDRVLTGLGGLLRRQNRRGGGP